MARPAPSCISFAARLAGLALATGWLSAAVAGGLPMPADSTGGYVGAETCLRCHPSAFQTWVYSGHARASLVFGTRRGMGMMRMDEREAARAGQAFPCRTCHAPPAQEFSRWIGPGYHPEDGVQCETCHGPGAEHLRVEAARDTLGGHKIYNPPPNNDLCQACHYEEKPYHTRAQLGMPVFDYGTWWSHIAHPTPQEERARR